MFSLLTSPAVFLGWFVRWKASGRTAVVLSAAASKIYSKQQAASFYSCYLVCWGGLFCFVFSIRFIMSKCCNHTIVLTRLQLRRSTVFLSERSDIVDNLLIADHGLPMCRLISLSVDEIILPGHMN